MGDGGILGGRMRAWLHALSSASGRVAGLGDQVAVKGESSKFLPTELERSRTTDREGQRRLGSKATIPTMVPVVIRQRPWTVFAQYPTSLNELKPFRARPSG